MSNVSRTHNAISNSIWGIAASGITILLNFVVRVVFVRELGEEINGINSLFHSVISIMALMELGIGSAMIIHLYEPVKNGNQEMMRGILSFYKTIYTWLSLIFFTIGIGVSLFLIGGLVESSIPLSTIRIYFLLCTASISLNYLTYYKRSILFAEQKNRISTGYTALCELLFRIAQIALILVFHQYIVYLVLLIAEKLTSNYLCTCYVNRHHPYLRNLKGALLPRSKKRAIFDTIKPLMVNQTANTVQQSSSSIMIGILLGNVSIVGYYGNYQLLMSVVQLVYSQFGGAFTTSFGNLAVSKDTAKMQEVYRKTAFLLDWIACLCCSAFLVCVDDFIYMAFGPNFVLSGLSVVIIVVNMMVYLLNIPVISIQNAMGLHRYDAWQMIFQALLAVLLEYMLGRIFGMPGILIGMVVPLIIFTLIWKGLLISHRAMGMSHHSYVRFIMGEVFKIVLVCVVAYVLCHLITMNVSVLSIAVKFLVATIVSLLIPSLLSYKRPEYAATIELLNSLLAKVKRNK